MVAKERTFFFLNKVSLIRLFKWFITWDNRETSKDFSVAGWISRMCKWRLLRYGSCNCLSRVQMGVCKICYDDDEMK